MSTARLTGKVLGSQVEVATLRSSADNILAMAQAQRPGYVCFTTSYMLVLAARDPEVHRTYQRAALITADGMPVAWALRLLGQSRRRLHQRPAPHPHPAPGRRRPRPARRLLRRPPGDPRPPAGQPAPRSAVPPGRLHLLPSLPSINPG